MAASGIFISTVAEIKTTLTGLGLKPVTDPRNARPLTVFVELPTFDGFNNNIADITCVLRVLGPPPGNQDASDYILTICDTIHGSSLAVVSGAPSIALIGEQQLPAYDLTIRLSTRRT